MSKIDVPICRFFRSPRANFSSSHSGALAGTLSILWIPAVLLFFSGCVSRNPATPMPRTDTPSEWQTPAGDAQDILEEWWTIFDDPTLTGLIRDVRESNWDIHAAVARIESYAAGYGVARAGLWPVVGLQASGAWDRETERVRNPLKQSSPDNPTGLYRTGFTMAWEIDLWNRIGSEMAAARGQWRVSAADMRNLMVMLQAQLASEYILLRTTQERTEHAQRNVELQTDTLKIVRDRFDAGLTGELDLHQAKMNLESTRAQLPSLRTQETEAINAICLLTGRLPGELEQLRQSAPIPSAEALPKLLPADLLQRRPDIRSAQINLIAQAAKTEAARAELLPSLSLTGNFALAASDTAELFRSEAEKYSIGPVLNWTLFSGGAIRSGIAAEDALRRVAVADYQQKVLSAFGECEDALAAYRNETDRYGSLISAVAAAQKSVELSQDLYMSGLVNFQNVLDMQRQLASYQDQMAYSNGMKSSALIAVYKAFGGGWTPTDALIENTRE